MSSLFSALEEEVLELAGVTEVSNTDELPLENFDQQAEIIESAEAEIEAGENAVQALENLQSLITSIGSKDFTQTHAQFTQRTLSAAMAGLGVTTQTSQRLYRSLENAYDPYSASLESVGDGLKRIGTAIKEAIQKLIAKIKQFIQWIGTKLGLSKKKQEEAAKDLKEAVNKADSEKKEVLLLELKKPVEDISKESDAGGDNETNVKRLRQVIKSLAKSYHSEGKMFILGSCMPEFCNVDIAQYDPVHLIKLVEDVISARETVFKDTVQGLNKIVTLSDKTLEELEGAGHDIKEAFNSTPLTTLLGKHGGKYSLPGCISVKFEMDMEGYNKVMESLDLKGHGLSMVAKVIRASFDAIKIVINLDDTSFVTGKIKLPTPDEVAKHLEENAKAVVMYEKMVSGYNDLSQASLKLIESRASQNTDDKCVEMYNAMLHSCSKAISYENQIISAIGKSLATRERVFTQLANAYKEALK